MHLHFIYVIIGNTKRIDMGKEMNCNQMQHNFVDHRGTPDGYICSFDCLCKIAINKSFNA